MAGRSYLQSICLGNIDWMPDRDSVKVGVVPALRGGGSGQIAHLTEAAALLSAPGNGQTLKGPCEN